MTDNNNAINTAFNTALIADVEAPNNKGLEMNNIDNLSQYLKSVAGTREGRAIPPLESWHPEQDADMDLTIKANGEWWHEGRLMTRESLVSLFATILWQERKDGVTEYFLKTPVQKLRIQVEDAPFLINDVGIVHEDNESWLEFTTTTGDIVRLDNEHPITLQAYVAENEKNGAEGDDQEEPSQYLDVAAQIRPYMLVRNGLTALVGRNVFYHLTEIGELTEQNNETILTLQSGGDAYALSMPSS